MYSIQILLPFLFVGLFLNELKNHTETFIAAGKIEDNRKAYIYSAVSKTPIW